MKREELVISIGEMQVTLQSIKVLAESVVPFEVAQDVIDKLAADAAILGIDGMPREFLRQCQITRSIPLR